MSTATRRVLGTAALILAAFAALSAAQDSPYIRVVDPDRHTIRLDVAVRTLTHDRPDAPLVQLVGAVHIADGSFYRDVQSFLDVHDVVLYEGVGGAREATPEPVEGDEGAALRTARRVLFLAMVGDDLRRRNGDHPATTSELIDGFEGSMRAIVEGASRDGWGNEITVENGRFDVVSLGADGRVGGDGAAADIRASDLLARPVDIVPDPAAAGLQRDLAEALGLEFQLDGIDYSHPHWRNSDMNLGEIQEALGGAKPGDRGAPVDADSSDSLKAADALFRTLSGESFLAKLGGGLMKMIGASRSGRAMTKIMLADTLTQAEDLLKAQPGGLADLMTVIIDERNRAVVRDLTEIVEREPDVRSVAIFYGAGHFGDLEQRITDELGYRYESTLWIPAMTIDLREAGLSSTQVNFMRGMMRDMIQSQLEMMRDR